MEGQAIVALLWGGRGGRGEREKERKIGREREDKERERKRNRAIEKGGRSCVWRLE